MFPLLRIGSTGQSVRTLQEALNIWSNSSLPPLRVDYSFGDKTDGKVREFQTKSNLDSDGVVGPATWETLKPWVYQILGQILPPSATEAGDRIANVAESALSIFGWGPGPVVADPNLMKIAAAICAAPEDPLRPRQGGFGLLSIFHIAGAPGQYILCCPTIGTEAAGLWQACGKGDQTARKRLNNIDLPAWCGIYCYYVYRCAGIDLGGWVSRDSNMEGINTKVGQAKRFHVFRDPNQAFRGCIGVIDPNVGNHHFIVLDNQNGVINSIDGNVFGPNPDDRSTGLKSVIARNKYFHSTLRKEGCFFLFPNFLKDN